MERCTLVLQQSTLCLILLLDLILHVLELRGLQIQAVVDRGFLFFMRDLRLYLGFQVWSSCELLFHSTYDILEAVLGELVPFTEVRRQKSYIVAFVDVDLFFTAS
jgi:hypothetical protein